jgi:allantoate deiminase
VIDVDHGLVERLLLELARHGGYGETGVWRTAYSPEWVAAQDQVAAWFAEAGLEVRRDAVGSVRERLAGSERGSVIATGSHIDSQTPGGRYDGALGVVARLFALRTLREQFGSQDRENRDGVRAQQGRPQPRRRSSLRWTTRVTAIRVLTGALHQLAY